MAPAVSSPSAPILVTGAAGFIGFHVAGRLLAEGRTVIGVDNFNSYYDVGLKEARWARLEGHSGFSGRRLDLVDRQALFRLCEELQPGAFVHLAAQAGVRYGLENPQAYVDSNLVGFVNVLEAARTFSIAHLV